ncbi:unnamed protein product [Calypogeia fissa]
MTKGEFQKFEYCIQFDGLMCAYTSKERTHCGASFEETKGKEIMDKAALPLSIIEDLIQVSCGRRKAMGGCDTRAVLKEADDPMKERTQRDIEGSGKTEVVTLATIDLF